MVKIVSTSRFRLDKKTVAQKATSYLEKLGLHEKFFITIVFVGKRKMRSYSNTYKHEDVALPVLSFFYGQEKDEKEARQSPYAEIIICYPQAVLLAAQRNKIVDAQIISLVEHGIRNLVNK